MDIEAIRRGLAANLRAIPDCQVSPWLIDSPTTACLQVAGFDEIDYLQDFGSGASLTFAIEGATTLAGGSRAAYDRFDRWLLTGAESVWEAIEADDQLTSRWQDDGSILAGQPAACYSLVVRTFRGYRRTKIGNVEVLLGDWLVRVNTE